MGLGDVIGKAVDAYNGNATGTTLEDFLTKFTPTGGAYVNTIDPLHTFEISFQFLPKLASTQQKKGIAGVLNSLAASGEQALNNALNNVTGGLAGAFMNDSKKGVLDQHKEFGVNEDKSFMNYLLRASLLMNGDNIINLTQQSSENSPIVLNMGYYVQSITVPMLKMADGGKSDTQIGSFPVNGPFVAPDNNQLTLTVINTKFPLLEMIFYPWMREVTLPYWSYESQPYTTAIVTIDMSKHTDMQYVFYGCRPQVINTMQPTQEPDSTITRDVTLLFDFMFVTSKYSTHESGVSKLLDSGAKLAGAGAKMLNL